ncbi:MAG: recombination protein RecR [Phycisphaeraceae bacterium]|nr:recombination protein RecR [Phycisphaeraceae bacterium]
MASSGSDSLTQNLLEKLCRLPGIGRRSAQRIIFYLLKQPSDEAGSLAGAIKDLVAQVQVCATCGNIGRESPCDICRDPNRDRSTIMVVEQPLDVQLMEDTGQYRGLYHVLMGRLAPLDDVGAGDLNIAGLIQRIADSQAPASTRTPDGPNPVAEVILAMQPSVEGDGTALHVARKLEKFDVRVSRLARGLPTGASLDMVSKAVLMDALGGRRALGGRGD